MTIKEAMTKRHSVRKYKNEKISEKIIKELQTEIDACNQDGDVRFELITQDNKSFGGFFTHYGRFNNVSNFIVLCGKKKNDLAERIGYYGECIEMKALMLGLNTCWVTATYNKKKCNKFLKDGEEMLAVITLGYGIELGKQHKSKKFSEVCKTNGDMPEWFQEGVKMALLAPTGMNRQNFMFTLDGKQVQLHTFDSDCSELDKGIVKYHFEIGAGKDNFSWKI